jgi:hypothetical protein
MFENQFQEFCKRVYVIKEPEKESIRVLSLSLDR